MFFRNTLAFGLQLMSNLCEMIMTVHVCSLYDYLYSDGATTLSIMALSIITLSITTFSIVINKGATDFMITLLSCLVSLC